MTETSVLNNRWSIKLKWWFVLIYILVFKDTSTTKKPLIDDSVFVDKKSHYHRHCVYTSQEKHI